MAQQLKALGALNILSEVPGLIPCTPRVSHNHLKLQSLRI